MSELIRMFGHKIKFSIFVSFKIDSCLIHYILPSFRFLHSSQLLPSFQRFLIYQSISKTRNQCNFKFVYTFSQRLTSLFALKCFVGIYSQSVPCWMNLHKPLNLLV